MQLQNETKIPIISYQYGEFKKIDDTIVTEYALTIKLNGVEFATLVCTPEYLEDMVIGFLASENVIKNLNDIEDLWIEENRGFAHVTVKEKKLLYEKFRSKRYVTSCCGMSRQGFYFVNDAFTAKKLDNVKITLTPNECISLMEALQQQASTFKRTGGVHNAGMCDTNNMLFSRMDIGRHNALDKLYGYCLKHSIPTNNKILVFSGRVSSEILIKASKIGCAVILSKSAPTELALEIADQLGITTIGFIRNKSFNIYTHAWRIQQDQDPV
ncbi:formate dehydrogenase accessory sulfurtransferase FdhD [Neobacillus ginsengisoli]|uniref:formate dehydrogenase accessory sulfurtransferase FdhD n=1 Tax=Neobacillus ginsengisoli TaxID=904295 RepID=UPI0035209740